jgi:hypothetical protein
VEDWEGEVGDFGAGVGVGAGGERVVDKSKGKGKGNEPRQLVMVANKCVITHKDIAELGR